MYDRLKRPKRTAASAPPFCYTDVTFMGGGSSNSTRGGAARDAGKWRVREAYARPLEDLELYSDMQQQQQQQRQQHSCLPTLLIVPDPLAWRTYLPWILHLWSLLQHQHHHQQPQSTVRVHFVLLESVVQDLELRNQFFRHHPSLDLEKQTLPQRTRGRPEVAFPQERTRLWKLLRDQSMQQHRWFLPFCDLSVRDVDFDEYHPHDRFSTNNNYNDDTGDDGVVARQRFLALRAARLLAMIMTPTTMQMQQISQGQENTVEVLLWLQQQETATATPRGAQSDRYGSQTTKNIEPEGESVQFVKPETLLQILQQQALPCLSSGDLERLERLRRQCEDDYWKRQLPKELVATSTATLQRVWTRTEIDEAVRHGSLGRGRFQVSKDNPLEAFVSWNGTMWFIPISGNSSNNYNNNASSSASLVRAIDQDIVIIEPLSRDLWQQPIGKRRLVSVTNKDSDDDNVDGATEGEQVLSKTTTISGMPTARIIRVDQLGPRRVVVATLTDTALMSDESAVLVVPMDIRIPKIRLQSREWQKWVGVRLLVQLADVWEEDSKYPAGHVQQLVGPIGDLETEITCLLHEHRIPLEPWSLASRACLPSDDNFAISSHEIAQRLDLRRTHAIFSVDPVGCQDIDDCMHARRLPNGDIEVGVHIADVTHFVPLNSPLDLQARQRGTTFYLVDRRFDMLPSILSSNLCSLHGGTDRLAVSVIWTLTEDMSQILSTWYGRTVIHNVAAMTYDQADRILSGDPPDFEGQGGPPPLTAGAPVKRSLIPTLRDCLTILTRLARQRRRERQDYGGAVDLSSGDTGTELKFTLVDGEPVKVQPKQTKEIHRTIEELMIWANTSVASKIRRTFPDAALLRIHRAVEEERFDDLKGLLSAGKIAFKGKTNAELAESLERAQAQSNKTVASLFRSLATRAMSEALYVSTGSTGSVDRLAHYGLGLKEYTHFTSPIRRYADVIVHHQLLAALLREQTQQEQLRKNAIPNRSIRLGNPVLTSLPQSNVISLLRDEAAEVTEDDAVDSEIDQLIADSGPSRFVDSSDEKQALVGQELERTELATDGPFVGQDVASICEHLNIHNRLAKHSATDCQGLFLGLYFRNHVECTQAVVTDLRENGFFCYIPKFDMRAPVFLRDMDGHVQIDPAFFDLPRTSGAEPTRGFAATESIRRFDPSESEIWYKENELLEVFVRCRSFALRPLDVIMVSISCPDWDNRARIPQPRVQLIHQKTERSSMIPASQSVTSDQLSSRDTSNSTASRKTTALETSVPSLSDLLEGFPSTLSCLDKSSAVSRGEGLRPMLTNKTVAGRLSWGGFVNPDTRAAEQAAAQEAAATLRNDRPIVSRNNDYDKNYRVARDVTSRQQRLAAEKRNTRRAKRN